MGQTNPVQRVAMILCVLRSSPQQLPAKYPTHSDCTHTQAHTIIVSHEASERRQNSPKDEFLYNVTVRLVCKSKAVKCVHQVV